MPLEFNISELPSECYQIKAAYLWWTVSYRNENEEPPTVLVNNPNEEKSYYSTRTIGSDIGKCWNDFGEKGTRAYKADITKSITVNGNYQIGINQSIEEIDGLTLLIVYRDLKSDYQGNLFLSDGLITMQRKDTNIVLNDIYVCDTSMPSSSKAFLVIADLQANQTNATSQISIDGIPFSVNRKFWNSEIFNIGKLAPGKKAIDYEIQCDDDCYSLVMNGLYFRTGEKCKLCPERVKFSIKSDKNAVCEGSEVTITAKGAPRYIWSDINGEFSTDSIVKVKPPRGGMFYTIKALSVDGCLEGINTIMIDTYEKPLANAGKDVYLCGGDFAKIGMAPNEGCFYAWQPVSGLSSPNNSNPSASPDTTTTYILTVLTTHGCVNYDTVTVFVAPALKTSHPDTIRSCPGKPIWLDANVTEGTKPYTYKWEPKELFINPNEPIQKVTLLGSQQIRLTITDSKECTAKVTFSIVINSDINLTAGNDKIICPGNSAQIDGFIEGGQPPYQILWLPSRDLSSANILNPVASPQKTTKYYLSIADSRQCYAFDSVTVFVNDSISSAYPDTAATCAGVGTKIRGSVSGGIKPYRYKWEPAAGLSSDSVAEPTVTTDLSDKYYLTVNDSLDCEIMDSIYVKVLENPVFDLDDKIKLCRDGLILIGSEINKGLPPYTIEWYPHEGLNRYDTNYVQASPANSQKYYMKVTDVKGCISLDSITIEVVGNPEPSIKARGNPKLCVCDSLLIECEGEFSSYYWSDGSKSKSIIVKTGGEYFVVAFDSNGCSGISNIIDVVFYEPEITIETPGVLETETGKQIELPLIFLFDDDFIKCGRLNYSGNLSFNKTILLPTGSTPMGYTEGSGRIIPFSGVIDTGKENKLVFNFITALGNNIETPVTITGLNFGGCLLDYKINETKVVLTDVCTKGSPSRLFILDGKPLVISVYPVPANDELSISTVADDKGSVKITVSSIYGNKLLEYAIEVAQGTNTYTISLENLPSGVYIICTDGSFDDSCRQFIIVK